MTTSPSHNTYKYNDQAKLNALTNLMVQNIDKIYDYFDLTEQEINHYLSVYSENKDVCHDMVYRALAQNSRDNLTVGLIRVSN